MNKKIIFTGGGTAGHVMVNVAIIPELKKLGWDIEYIGSENGIEKNLITNVKYHKISTGKLRRYWDWNNLKDPFKVIRGSLQSYKLIKNARPNVIFSAGGFVSVPVVLGAWLNRVPIIIREPDSTIGLANKIAIPFADKLCITFPDTKVGVNPEQIVYTGPIIREEIKNGSLERGLAYCGFTKDKPTLLIMGGSQGAERINQMLQATLDKLLVQFNIVHICGKGKMNSIFQAEGYRQFEYINEQMPDILAMADLVISRAGSSAISELLVLKKPTLLIPLSDGSSRGDQIINAEFCKRNKYAKVLLQENMDEEVFIESIEDLYRNREQYIKKMEKNKETGGINKVVNLIEDFI
ncbi:undecaprenyldiphospho-muramoylpentapeptide beta-N-acetylglucosaminyltransferase [Bacillus cereus VD133]|uniref:UDP-N-acetylglucosamine--N-acetylmuramyl-(pentapeptide) pyrophosphoryl-undecaprenol N-acetylglucosamine transferase n=1 Tax=Bacillus cereus VD133 TaxID=1053233 RepID=A0A9W5PL91_BACCE|nr:undecaprenyldiphospho-muramoylpentapeptide beta-N-acetylglucosaminyltransferase [Bacillus cereus]EOO27169.1 undecaprenyldiphospho-muramoylpentapeptide beta-N-acetylglucosaminyltransferase [Bacillus cereus VD133]